jgi:hypothetical protein
MARQRLAVWLALALPYAAAGCGTDAVGVQACRQIQAARCQQASSCGMPLAPPYRTSGTDVDACIRFYDVACLHGLSINMDPEPPSLNACVDAINRAPMTDGGCAVVEQPELADACAWLVPPSTPDSSSDSTADSSAE